MVTSRLTGLRDSDISGRRGRVAESVALPPEQLGVLDPAGGLTLDQADHMIENVVGVLGIPLGIGTNFVVDGVDRLIPMATEEPSVVAAAGNAARMAREHGGIDRKSVV